MPSSEPGCRSATHCRQIAMKVGKGLPTCLFPLALFVLAPQALAFDMERDTWLFPAETGARQDAERRKFNPLEFARIKATGNDQEPEYAVEGQLELIHAVEKRDRERIDALLKNGVNPNGLTGQWGKSALILAVEQGDVEITRLLLDAGADPDLKGGGYTPLVLAALRGHARIARLLLKAGANPDFKSGDGNSALTAAASMNRLDVIRVLMPFRPDYTLFNREGRTALSVAAMEGFEQAVRLMLETGVDANVQDKNKGTALDSTTFTDNKRIQKLLVDHGATTL
ncbi:MAG: hypothetical protein B7Y41_14100 [Hydrogenophilales bacterium 28-61-23]|nr:MAG: hypothetical protein B7Y41_14100 [Hydrogenophilales bacterium 28-61-23]